MNDDYLRSFTEQNPFSRACGCRLLQCSFEHAAAVMEIDPALHYNGAHIVHGGALMTLADFVCSAAANADGVLRLSCGGSYAFLRSAKAGRLTAEAFLVSSTRTLCYHRAEIRDESGALLFTAAMQACVRTGAPAHGE